MIKGFRKLVDIPIENLAYLEELERRLKGRARWERQTWTRVGPNRDQSVWRIFVYIGHVDIALGVLLEMDVMKRVENASESPKTKGVTIQ